MSKWITSVSSTKSIADSSPIASDTGHTNLAPCPFLLCAPRMTIEMTAQPAEAAQFSWHSPWNFTLIVRPLKFLSRRKLSSESTSFLQWFAALVICVNSATLIGIRTRVQKNCAPLALPLSYQRTVTRVLRLGHIPISTAPPSLTPHELWEHSRVLGNESPVLPTTRDFISPDAIPTLTYRSVGLITCCNLW